MKGRYVVEVTFTEDQAAALAEAAELGAVRLDGHASTRVREARDRLETARDIARRRIRARGGP